MYMHCDNPGALTYTPLTVFTSRTVDIGFILLGAPYRLRSSHEPLLGIENTRLQGPYGRYTRGTGANSLHLGPPFARQ